MERQTWAAVGLVLVVAASAGATSDSQQSAPGRSAAQQEQQPPATDTLTPNIPGVVAAGTKVQVIASDFQNTEGPIGLPDGGFIFTENRADRIVKIDKNNNVSTFLESINGSNALAFDGKGRLISAQTTPGRTRVGVIFPKGSEAVLSDNFEGKPFGRPNDLVIDRKGGVYFTDFAVTPGGLLPPAVYYIPPGGKAIKIADGIERPNGIMLSPDEKVLYVSNTRGEYLVAFDVKADGTVSNRRKLAKYQGASRTADGIVSGADGLAVDSMGRIYVATLAGVEVLSPKGEHLGTILTSRAPQNLAFGDSDKKTLYIVAHGAALKVRLLAQGFRERAK